MKKSFVQILTMEHVMHTTPCSFVITQVVMFENMASLPITGDELLKDDRFHHRDIDFPFPEPLATLNEVLVSAEHR